MKRVLWFQTQPQWLQPLLNHQPTSCQRGAQQHEGGADQPEGEALEREQGSPGVT